mmetsp:Transcript_29443/g.69036  ORF Transcript_29443/g.69036 Transcript_29443/m.69036 type:complete len:221 (+) Transcript_29443:392-1054(+)
MRIRSAQIGKGTLATPGRNTSTASATLLLIGDASIIILGRLRQGPDLGTLHSTLDIKLLEYAHIEHKRHVGLGHQPIDLVRAQLQIIQSSAVLILELFGVVNQFKLVEPKTILAALEVEGATCDAGQDSTAAQITEVPSVGMGQKQKRFRLGYEAQSVHVIPRGQGLLSDGGVLPSHPMEEFGIVIQALRAVELDGMVQSGEVRRSVPTQLLFHDVVHMI